METLIIYDMKGNVINQITGEGYRVPNGIPYIEVIIPKNKYVVSVNVETKEPIYADIPKTEVQLLADKISILETENETLKQELSITQDAVNELIFNSLNI